jgi:hypothetical protein
LILAGCDTHYFVVKLFNIDKKIAGPVKASARGESREVEQALLLRRAYYPGKFGRFAIWLGPFRYRFL